MPRARVNAGHKAHRRVLRHKNNANLARRKELLARASAHDSGLVLELLEAKLRDMGYEVVLHNEPHAWVGLAKIEPENTDAVAVGFPGSAGLPQETEK